jgi:putative heme iron utilization protein
MNTEDLHILRGLLTESRVLSLGVLVDGIPHVGLLPFVISSDYGSALIHASQLARHSRGLQPGSQFSILIHAGVDDESDALQVPRVTFSGVVHLVAHTDLDYEASRRSYIKKFPSSEKTFFLGDFNLYRLHFERGWLVAGFARAITLGPGSLEELSRTDPAS